VLTCDGIFFLSEISGTGLTGCAIAATGGEPLENRAAAENADYGFGCGVQK
jgi:hypothetical protein